MDLSKIIIGYSSLVLEKILSKILSEYFYRLI